MTGNRNNAARYLAFITSSILIILLSFAPFTFAMSIDEEAKAGKEFMESIKGYPTIEDAFVNKYLSDLGNYIGQFQDSKPFPLNFYIAKDYQLNAFAGPGGYIFIYSGLINAMDEVDELASIMAHEIGHVSVRHLSRQGEKGKMLTLGTMAGVLAGVLIGADELSEAVITGSMAAGMQAQLSYSRDDEREADQLGFKFADAAGFRSEAFIKALEQLQKGQWGTDQTFAYLSTHPVDSERMANLSAMRRQSPESKDTDKVRYFRGLYPLIRTIVRAQSIDPKDAEKYFTSQLEKTPDSDLAHFGLAMALQNKGDYQGALSHYNISLMGLDEKGPVLRYLGETYGLSGQTREAINTYEKALEIDKSDKSVLYLLAMSYQDAEDYTKAVEIYNRLSLMDQVKDDVFYNLGMCLGRQNSLALAHYNFGIYYKRLKDKETAEFHFKKAGQLAGNDQTMQDKIRKEQEDMMKKDDKEKPQQGNNPK